MAGQLDDEWGNSKQVSLRQCLDVGTIHQPHIVGAPTKASLADADWLNASFTARYAGSIPADEPLVLTRRTFRSKELSSALPISCICIKDPRYPALAGHE